MKRLNSLSVLFLVLVSAFLMSAAFAGIATVATDNTKYFPLVTGILLATAMVFARKFNPV